MGTDLETEKTDVETEKTTEKTEPGSSPSKRRAWVTIPDAFLVDPEIHSTTLRLWGILALYVEEDWSVTMTLDQIAALAATFVSQRQALVQMKTLERMGMVDVTRGTNGYRRIPNTYHLRTSRRRTSRTL